MLRHLPDRTKTTRGHWPCKTMSIQNRQGSCCRIGNLTGGGMSSPRSSRAGDRSQQFGQSVMDGKKLQYPSSPSLLMTQSLVGNKPPLTATKFYPSLPVRYRRHLRRYGEVRGACGASISDHSTGDMVILSQNWFSADKDRHSRIEYGTIRACCKIGLDNYAEYARWR